jgi:hypothetical protein
VHVPFNKKKATTHYELVALDGSTVLHAQATSSVSMVMHEARLDLAPNRYLHWRWKVGTLPNGADNSSSSREDAAARVVLVFEGDRSRLSWVDRSIMATADLLSDSPMPYATLMYITSSVEPIGTIIRNPHTRRVQMIVAAHAEEAMKQWQSLSRDVVQDYRAAFGEDPGVLHAYGVMTDSDNTRSEAQAWYGDILFNATP